MAKYCGHCGAKMRDDAKFCGMCGATFGNGKKPIVPQEPKRLPKAAWVTAVLVCVAIVAVIVLGNYGSKGNSLSQSNDDINVKNQSNQSRFPFVHTDDSENSLASIRDIENEKGIEMLYPNFEELSVGRAWDNNGTVYEFLFDKDGLIHYTSDNNHWILSGFYDGMCLMGPDSMMDADGNLFKPDFLTEEEKIVRYAKDSLGVILWTIKKDDTIEGSVTTLTAWNSNGTILFRGDTRQDSFSKISPSSMYEKLLEDCGGNGGTIWYCGGAEYRIKCFTDYLFINLQTQKASCVHDASGASATSSGEMVVRSSGAGPMRYIKLYDTNGNMLPESENMVTRRGSLSVFREGLIFLDAYINDGNGKKYPAGFYDADLNQVIDLSEYDVNTVLNMEPCFINGYAVLQMQNSDGVPFWGVLNKDGSWNFTPQKGIANGVLPLGDGLLINVKTDEESSAYCSFNENGENLGDEWNDIRIDGGYERAPFEFYDGFLYTNLLDNSWRSHIARIDTVGNFEFLT